VALEKKAFILVMGGLGFIGSHLSRALIKEGHRVRIFDKLYNTLYRVSDILDQVEILQGDIQRSQDVLAACRDVDIAVDLVHTTVPGSSMKDPGYDIESNVVAHARWLSRIGETSISKIIYISSGGTVYGIPQTIPIDENHQTDPISSYGITKLAVEKYVAMYAKMNCINYCICRPSNVYGEGQQLNVGQGVIGVFLDRALRGLPVEIWGDGEIRRDYLYILDLISALQALVAYEGNERVFNISSGRGVSLNEIHSAIQKVLHKAIPVQKQPKRDFDVPTNILDNRLLMQETSWSPTVNLEEGIARLYNYYNVEEKAKYYRQILH
jgi:UDP-glucose 4-epimerase